MTAGSRARGRAKIGAGLLALVFAWLLAVGAGSSALYVYSATPGDGAVAPRLWLSGMPVSLDSSRLTLVMAAHPRCSCSRASLSELARLMTDAGGRLRGHVLFFEPPGSGEKWRRTDLYESAQRIPGISVSADPDGVSAKALGARTSGQVFLYAPDGKLLFSGGLTPARGHQGDSVGRHRVLEALKGTQRATASAVYGCSIEERRGDAGLFSLLRLAAFDRANP